MNRLFVVRHGDYNPDTMRLTAEGRTRMRLLAEQLAPLLKGRSFKILSSTAPRAVESATELGEVLGIPVEKHEVLWSQNSRPTNMAAARQLVESQPVEDVIVVTHLEYTEEFPRSYRVIGAAHPIAKGEARMIDIVTKATTLFRPPLA